MPWPWKRAKRPRPRLGTPPAGAIYLVRHGEVENPRHVVYADLPGFGLSERGRFQAAAVADRLGDRTVAGVLSSPLDRAVQTATAIASLHALHPQIDERLTEWKLSGRWSGVVWEDLPREFPGELEAYLDHPDDLPFSPESLDDLASRVTEAILEFRAAVPEGDLVVVGHQDPIQAARLAITGRSLAGLPTDKPGHGGVVSLVSNISADAHSDADWVEGPYWEPEQDRTFPPPPPLAD